MNRLPHHAICILSVGIWLSPSVTECDGATAKIPHSHLSRVWQEEFSPPPPNSTETKARAGTYSPKAHLRSDQPHPAVVRVIVPENGATSYGSGTLVDVRGQFGLVITNWHVVRDAQGLVEVVFPGGFTSKARALKLDADWDLAALVIWRPPVEPVSIASTAPQPGDQLTICGYGQGIYRAATGRCTQYYAPRLDFPRHMVELDVEARQGDSGGPIFDRNGELAGVLFGAGQGTTLGSFGGRVGSFLATLAPDIGKTDEDALAKSEPLAEPAGQLCRRDGFCSPCQNAEPADMGLQPTESKALPARAEDAPWHTPQQQLVATWPSEEPAPAEPASDKQTDRPPPTTTAEWQAVKRNNWFEQLKTALAAVGVVAIAMLVLRAAR